MSAKRKFQVFVSSTFNDLLDERQAAVAAILKSGHIPAGMELFTSGSQSQLDTIYRWIDQCDIYMLILGGRYGSVEPKSGVSYTELEYDYAFNAGKPVFAVVIDENELELRVKKVGSGVLETDNPKQLVQFREKVLGKVASFFTDSKDVKLCVHESLSDLVEDNELLGWVHASEIVEARELAIQIQQLRAENTELKDQVSRLAKQSGAESGDSDNLVKILAETNITVPKGASATNEEFESNVLHIFKSNSETLVSGVTNDFSAGEAGSFLYFNVMPKLQVHGLAANEKVAGVRYRRSYITKKGLDLLAFLERRRIEAATNS